MKNLICYALILLGYCSCAGNKETCTTTGVVDKVVWAYKRSFLQSDGVVKLAYFSFVRDYELYTFSQDLHYMMKINVGDSVQIQYYCQNPKKAAFVKLIERKDSEHRGETKFIRTTGASRYSYHSVNKKPLFKDVQNYKDNDNAVDLYLKEQLKKMNVQEHGTVGVKIVIDETGKIIESTILSSTNQKLNDIVLTLIGDMPRWTPAEHKGEKVNVGYLIVLEWE